MVQNMYILDQFGSYPVQDIFGALKRFIPIYCIFNQFIPVSDPFKPVQLGFIPILVVLMHFHPYFSRSSLVQPVSYHFWPGSACSARLQACEKKKKRKRNSITSSSGTTTRAPRVSQVRCSDLKIAQVGSFLLLLGPSRPLFSFRPVGILARCWSLFNLLARVGLFWFWPKSAPFGFFPKSALHFEATNVITCCCRWLPVSLGLRWQRLPPAFTIGLCFSVTTRS